MKLATPHLPFPHYLGSVAWSDEERPLPVHALGEDQVGSQWDNGATAITPPPAIVFGLPAEFLGQWRNQPSMVPLIGGWPAACFEPLTPNDFIDRLDPFETRNWPDYAIILADQYSDPDLAELELRALAGMPNSVARVDNSSDLVPGSMIAVYNDYSIVVISGTTTFEQRALQAMALLEGPTDFGPFSTVPLWWYASSVMIDRLQAAGVDPSKPLILVGHSYGGSVAQTTAARLRLFGPNRRISVLTYGMAKPGDVRLRESMEGAPQVHLANIGDGVPWLPPSRDDLLPVPLTVPVPVELAWEQYVRPRNQYSVASNGLVEPIEPGLLAFGQLVDAVLWALFSGALPFIPDHEAGEYARRLSH